MAQSPAEENQDDVLYHCPSFFHKSPLGVKNNQESWLRGQGAVSNSKSPPCPRWSACFSQVGKVLILSIPLSGQTAPLTRTPLGKQRRLVRGAPNSSLTRLFGSPRDCRSKDATSKGSAGLSLSHAFGKEESGSSVQSRRRFGFSTTDSSARWLPACLHEQLAAPLRAAPTGASAAAPFSTRAAGPLTPRDQMIAARLPGEPPASEMRRSASRRLPRGAPAHQGRGAKQRRRIRRLRASEASAGFPQPPSPATARRESPGGGSGRRQA